MNTTRPKQSTRTVKAMVKQHYREIAQSAMVAQICPRPKEGWIRSIRKALDMSGAQLASRLNISRNRVSVIERREAEGEVTINQLKAVAAQLGCEVTYMLVPKKDIDVMLDDRAEKIALSRLSINAQNMHLEAQSLSREKQAFLMNELKKELLEAGGRVLWKTTTDESSK